MANQLRLLCQSVSVPSTNSAFNNLKLLHGPRNNAANHKDQSTVASSPNDLQIIESTHPVSLNHRPAVHPPAQSQLEQPEEEHRVKPKKIVCVLGVGHIEQVSKLLNDGVTLQCHVPICDLDRNCSPVHVCDTMSQIAKNELLRRIWYIVYAHDKARKRLFNQIRIN
jgi:hypothetical protein